jgi:hypothetical protein
MARSTKKSGFLWALMAILTYYIPILIFGVFIYPFLVYGLINPSNQTFYMILGAILNIIIGIFFLLLLRARLLRLSKNKDLEEEKIRKIDHSKRISLNFVQDPANLVGEKAFDSESNKYIGIIFKLDIENKQCTINNDFNNELVYPFEKVLINSV